MDELGPYLLETSPGLCSWMTPRSSQIPCRPLRTELGSTQVTHASALSNVLVLQPQYFYGQGPGILKLLTMTNRRMSKICIQSYSLWTRWFRRSWVISSCHCFRIPVLDGWAAVGIGPREATLAFSFIIGLYTKEWNGFSKEYCMGGGVCVRSYINTADTDDSSGYNKP